MVNSLLPPELLDVLQGIRPVFHAASWESFLYLVTGLLLGYARASVVRASLVAPSGYNWRRLHAFVRRNRWRESELLQALTQVVLTTLYPAGWPSHLFWVLDTTYLEKVYAQATEGVLRHYRPHPKRGQGRLL